MIIRICLLAFVLVIGLSPNKLSAQSQLERPEVQEKLHQFDFWLGEWEVYKNGTDTIVGYSRIESVMNGVGLQENYRSANSPYEGTSLNKYNFRTLEWEQFYIDNSGSTIKIHGGYSDGKMILSNRVETAQGVSLNRITWYDNADGSVRQHWQASQDEGETWSTLFDGIYKKS